MKKTLLFISVFLSLVIVFFTGCQKQVDTADVSLKPQEIAGTPLPGQSTYCRIESIWERPFARGERFILVLYNEFENPVAITTPLVGTGTPFRTFKYDSWHRLREFRGEYSNGGAEFWHFYGYDLNGRIGIDTNYQFSIMGPNGPISYSERYISKIDYDAQGRISKVVTNGEKFSFHNETVYNYDASGNLIHPSSMNIVYDNKVNINRTNDIWQFLTRDYSVNNPLVAAAYNPAGLPTVVTTAPGILWSSEFQQGIPMQINYSCR